ncbi:MAG: hypothetical protein IPM16_20710 [Chloroflexi bacterium]|nr:hypothetical protein [Chloroflexota bacterium]
MTEVTVVGNRAESDDGLSGSAGRLAPKSEQVASVQDSLIEQNYAAHVGCLSVGGSLISLGGNAISDTSGCNYVAHPTDRIDNLLDNGGFEFAAGDPAVPDAWTPVNLTGDKRKCNTSAKTFTDYGRCALVFKGGPGESAQFTQDVDLLTHTFSAGEVLELYAMGWGGPAGSVVVQAKATYADPLLAATKAKLVLQGSAVAVEDVNALALTDGDLTQLTVKVKHKSPSGKMMVDRVYLTRSLAAPRGLESGPLPPPAAPDGFRGGN